MKILQDPTVDVSQALKQTCKLHLPQAMTYDTNPAGLTLTMIWFMTAPQNWSLMGCQPMQIRRPSMPLLLVPNGTANGVYNMRIGTADSGQATPNPVLRMDLLALQ